MSIARHLALVLFLGSAISACTQKAQVNSGATTSDFRDCAGCPEMVVILAGTFLMGSPEGEAGRQNDEGPQHKVVIAKNFAVGKFEVTVDEYLLFAQETGKGGHDWRMVGYPDGPVKEAGGPYARYPVRDVNWPEAQDYLLWLSERSGKQYRLLTEAEWEYVARAGSPASEAWEPSRTIGFQSPDPYRHSSPVGSFSPNAFGVYDMTGNITEWTADCYAPYPTDLAATTEGTCAKRVVRGGFSFGFNGESNFVQAEFLRIANRDWRHASVSDGGHTIGFRVARAIP